MHMPDGFVSAPVIAATGAISAAATGFSLSRARREIDDHAVPALGVCTAFIFAAQMINFPVAGGTSGHLIGAFLAMLLLGPAMGFLAILIVTVLQALLFADGGVIVLGTNVFNLGIAGGLLPYALFRLVVRRGPGGRLAWKAAFFAWFAVVIASASCAVELALSKTSPAAIVIPAMTGIHALIGVGEGIVTFSFLKLIESVRPDLLAGIPGSAAAPERS